MLRFMFRARFLFRSHWRYKARPLVPVLLFILLAGCASELLGQGEIPKWCKELPRAEFKGLERVQLRDARNDAWFEVYRVAAGVFAVYEPRQSEETIGYLIVGGKRALLFDSGMGIGDVREVVTELTKLPVVVMNSHTHYDHVGGNWEFDTVYGMDTAFTRQSARGGTEVKGEIAPGEICGALPEGFDAKNYKTRPWKIAELKHDGDKIDLGGRVLEIVATPGHTPDAICLWDSANGLLFSGDTYYKGTVWLYRPETDLDAYGSSVKRLAELAPRVKMVLGAHNVPVMPPTVLPELAAAFAKVRAGEVAGKDEPGGKVVYKVGEISFLMKAAQR
jgi:glyoxylase-like metal-dependent hydrolase (beta-lactamase superfamily II)